MQGMAVRKECRDARNGGVQGMEGMEGMEAMQGSEERGNLRKVATDRRHHARGLTLLVALAAYPGVMHAQGFREAPRAPSAGQVAPIQAPASGPRAVDAQTAGGAGASATLPQAPADATKAPSADMSVEEMVKALSAAASGTGKVSGPGATAGSSTAPVGAAGSPGVAQSSPSGSQPIQGSLQSPGSPGQTPGLAAQPGGMVDLTIQFAFDSATILDESKPLLERLAKALNAAQLSNLRFVIEGHTDGVGNKTYNDQLSARRAQAVVEFLGAAGVNPARLRSQGKGFSELLYPQDPRAAANRRVRIKVGS